jgi:hypothetical protein
MTRVLSKVPKALVTRFELIMRNTIHREVTGCEVDGRS